MEHKKNILFIPIGESYRASSRFRVWEMVPLLEQAGYSCRIIPLVHYTSGTSFISSIRRRIYSKFVVEKKILGGVQWADVVVLQESLLSISLLKKIERAGPKVVYDFSDPIHLMHLDPLASFVKKIFTVPIDQRKFRKTLEIARTAIVENDEFLKLATSYSCQGIVMRGPINCKKYRPREQSVGGEDSITLGWTGVL